jgi:hypothetical protein
LQRVGGAVDRDLALFHGLEQRRLRLGRGPVDLIAEHDVGEHRTRLELEVAPLLVIGAHTGDVAGQQVRRELDPPHGAVDRPGQRLGQHGLAHPGHVLDEQVALGQQHRERELDGIPLALDDGLDRLTDPAGRRD